MQRFAAVWHASPQKMVGVLFALLLAAMMAVGSGANFNSTSANLGNMVTAGNLKHTNTGALLTIDKIKPGETRRRHGHDHQHRRHRRRLHGRQRGHGRLDARPPQAVRRQAHLEVDDQADGAPWSTTAARARWARHVGAIAAGRDAHVHDLRQFPDGGTGGADNDYKAASVTVDFNWEAVNN